MPQTFTCPNCNAPLSYDGKSVTIRCEYCSMPVRVPAYVDGMCFNDQNWLFTVSNDQRVRVWEVKP